MEIVAVIILIVILWLIASRFIFGERCVYCDSRMERKGDSYYCPHCHVCKRKR